MSAAAQVHGEESNDTSNTRGLLILEHLFSLCEFSRVAFCLCVCVWVEANFSAVAVEANFFPLLLLIVFSAPLKQEVGVGKVCLLFSFVRFQDNCYLSDDELFFYFILIRRAVIIFCCH